MVSSWVIENSLKNTLSAMSVDYCALVTKGDVMGTHHEERNSEICRGISRYRTESVSTEGIEGGMTKTLNIL